MMRLKTTVVSLLGIAMLSILVAACSRSEPTPTPVPSEITPPPRVSAPAQAAEIGMPTPTPVPEAERAVVLEFAISHQTITEDWERFHADFDGFRQGLPACEASSAEVTFRQLAGRFVSITEQARGLTRDSIVRALSDKAVSAAESEEEAVRHLRDNWRPGDTTVFENVDVQRSAASALRKQVEDELGDLVVRTAPASRAQVDAFSTAVQQLNADWDKFHRNYDAFRADEVQLTSSQALGRLSVLVNEFSDIVVVVRNLPAFGVTRSVARILSDAVEDEDLALRKLRDTLGVSGDASGEMMEAPQDSSNEAAPGSPDSAIFDAYDTQLVQSNALRAQAVQDLAEISGDTSEGSQASVQDFGRQFGLLGREWDDFHDEYDDWRVSEGGCDRSQVVATLGQFGLRFGEVADRVRALPLATFLRPLGELFVEAAEREEEALRTLRNTWRPFDPAVYETLNKERNDARKLRRQVAVGVQDLLARYAIPVQELREGSPSGQ